MRIRTLGLALACGLAACAHSPADDPLDPLEPFNRRMYTLNEKLDKYVARPAAKGYTVGVPAEIRLGVGNFFRNLTYPTVIVNDVLQGKVQQAGADTGRFLLNSTFGLAGFLDPASRIGLERNDEDFGQTLGRWGVGPGWYLMLPLLGPTSNRDLVGRAGSALTNPLTYADSAIAVPMSGLSAVESRAQLLGAERVLEQQFDRYVFVRGAYLQRRQSLVYDGNPPREEYDWEDEE
jgi:phospholipid-binding lipoprotein MlaA